MNIEKLKCVECSGNLEFQNDSYRCVECKKTFSNNDGVGVFFREDNQLFSNSEYENINKLSSPQKKYISLFNTVKKFVKFSVNKSFDESIKKIIGSYEQNDMDILIIGCGNQVEEFKKSYKKKILILLLFLLVYFCYLSLHFLLNNKSLDDYYYQKGGMICF